jgi:hypothetical protein
MKAKTAQQVAITAFTTAETAYKVASEALLLKRNEADYAASVAKNADLLIEAKYAMALAKVKFDSDLADATAKFAANGDKIAQAHLLGYTDAVKLLVKAVEDRLNIQSDLVAQELLVASNPKKITDYIASAQKTIDAENAKIAGAEAAIAVYNASTTGTDVTAFVTEKAALDLKNRTLAIANVRLLYDISRNDLVIAEQNKEVVTLKATRKTQDDSRVTKANEKTQLESATPKDDAAIAKLTKEIADLVASILVIDNKVIAFDASTKLLTDNNKEIVLAQTANVALTTKNNSIITALTFVINQLTGGYTANNVDSTVIPFPGTTPVTISDAVKAQEKIISDAEAIIKTATAQLSATSVKDALVAAQKLVVTQTAALATANVNVTALEKIVAYWKGLLDKIFTA